MMRALVLGFLVATSAAVAAPKSRPTPPPPPPPKLLVAREVCELPTSDYAKDSLVRKPSGTGPCAEYKRDSETLVALHVGRSNSDDVTVSRWWRTKTILHVELAVTCMPCHGADFGNDLHLWLYAVQVTGIDKLQITRRPATCPPQNCGAVP